MADELNKRLDYSDSTSEVSLVTRGAATAGLITAGLGIPSLWKTLQLHFPRGTLDSLVHSHIRGFKPSATDITLSISKAAFEKYSQPEFMAKMYAAAATKANTQKEAITAADKRVVNIRSLLREKTLEKDIRAQLVEAAAGQESMSEIARKIHTIENAHLGKVSGEVAPVVYSTDASWMINKDKRLLEFRRAALYNWFATIEHTGKYTATAKYFLERKGDVGDDVINSIFEDLVTKNNPEDKELARWYLAQLQGRPYKAVMADAYELNQAAIAAGRMADTIKPVYRPRKMFADFSRFNEYKPTPILMRELDTRATQKELAQSFMFNYSGVDRFVADVGNQLPWLKHDKYFSGITKSLRNFIRAMQDEVCMYNGSKSTETPAVTFQMRLEWADRRSKFPQVVVHVKQPGTKNEYTWSRPLPNQERMFMHSSETVYLSHHTMERFWANDPVEIRNANASLFMEDQNLVREIIGDVAKGWRPGQGKKFANLNRLHSSLFKDQAFEPVAGSPLSNLHRTEKIFTAPAHQMVSRRVDVRNRIPGLQDWQLLKLHKQGGRDIVVYDQEYYMTDRYGKPTHHGPQLAKKYPKQAVPWQISWRRISSKGAMVDSGTLYIEHEINEEAFKTSLEATGRLANYDYYHDQIKQSRYNEERAMRELEKKFDGALVVDQYGKHGADRLILNSRSQQWLGRDIIHESMAADTWRMTTALTVAKRGHGLDNILSRCISQASDVDINTVIKIFTHGDSTGDSPNARFIQRLKSELSFNPNRKREILTRVFRFGAHDAATDTAGTMAVLHLLTKQRPLMGLAETALARKDAYLRSGYISATDMITASNRWMMAKNYFGETQASQDLTDGYYTNMSFTDVSHGSILKGVANRLPSWQFRIFGVNNSLQKQDAQYFHGIPLRTMNEAGRFKDPFSVANEKMGGYIGEGSIARGIAQNAQPTLLKVAYLPRGSGFTPESTMFLDESIANTLYGGKLHTKLRADVANMVSGDSIELFGEAKQVFDKAKAMADKRGDKDIQPYIDKILQRRNRRAAYLDRVIRTRTGSMARKASEHLATMYTMPEDSAIARLTSTNKAILEHEYFQRQRLCDMEVAVKNGKPYKMAVQFEDYLSPKRQMPMLMTTMSGGKATQTVAKIARMLRPLTTGAEVIEDQLEKAGRSTPIEAIMETNAYARAEFGAVQRIQFMRIYGTFIAKGDHEGARRMLQDVFGHQRIMQDTDGSYRIKDTFEKVDDYLEVSNRFKHDDMFRWMREAGIVWDSKSIEHQRQLYNVVANADWKKESDAFDIIARRRFEKIQASHKNILSMRNRSEGAVEFASDAEQFKHIRKTINPYYNLQANDVIDARTTRNARPHDFFEDIRGVNMRLPMGKAPEDKHSIIAGWMTYDGLFASLAAEIQSKPVVNTTVYAPSFVINRQMDIFSGFKGSEFSRLISASQGAYQRKATNRLREFLDVFISGKSAAGEYTKVDDLNDVMRGLTDARIYSQKHRRNPKLTRFTMQLDESQIAQRTGRLTESMMDRIHDLEDVMKTNLSGPERTQTQNELDDLRKKVSGVATQREKLKAVSTYDLADNFNTIRERIRYDRSVGAYDERHKIHFGQYKGKDVRVAPYDMIMLETQGYSPMASEDFFEKVLHKVDEIMERMKIRKNQHTDAIKAQIKMIKSKFGQAPKNAMLMPTESAWMEIMKVGYRPEGVSKTIANPKKLRLYENALHMANDYINSKEVNRRGIADKLDNIYSSLVANLFVQGTGKEGLLTQASQYTFSGQRGTAISQEMIMEQGLEGWADLQRGGGIKAITEDMRVRIGKRIKDPTKLAELATKRYYRNVATLQLLRDPTNNFITKEKFFQSKVQGMPVRDWFMKNVEGSDREKKDLWGRILRGEAALPDMSARYPLPTHMWGVSPITTHILDTDLEIFRGKNVATEGIVVSTLFRKMMGLDFDNDQVNRMLVEMQSVASYNKHIKQVHIRNNRLMGKMMEFQNLWWKTGNFKKAKEELYRSSKWTADEYAMVEHLKSLVEENGVKLEYGIDERFMTKGMKAGYSLKTLNLEDRAKFAVDNLINDNIEMLGRFMHGETAEQWHQRELQAALNLNTARQAVGELSALTQRTQISLGTLKDFIFKKHRPDETSLFEQITKYFPGSVDKNADKTIQNVTDQIFRSEEAFDQLAHTVSGKVRGLAQTAISAKKLLGPAADRGIINLMQAWNTLQNPESRTFIGMGEMNEREVALLSMADVFHRTTMRHPIHAEEYNQEYSEISHTGWTPYNAMRDSVNRTLSQKLLDRSWDPKQQEEFLSNFWKPYGVNVESIATKASRGWANSIKQMLYGKTRDAAREFEISLNYKEDKFAGLKKFVYEHDLGKKGLYGFGAMGMIQLLSPNQMSGGPGDFFMDLGHRPGFGGEKHDWLSGGLSTTSSLNPEPGEDPFSKRWAHLVGENPILADKLVYAQEKNYREFQPPLRATNAFQRTPRSGKRRYINQQQRFEARYQTNDARRAAIPSF